MNRLLLFIVIFFCFILHSNAQGIPPREEVNLDDVYTQYDLNGEAVLVIMLDRGIDYRHPDFIDENGNTRIAYIYDMIDPTGASDPENPYGVGTIFTQDQINTSLDTGGDPLSTDRGGHGTATTGIIAGDGSGTTSGEFQGVAPNATIISIKIVLDGFPAFGDQPAQQGFYNPAYIPIALAFAADKIQELNLPSVTLMNIGSIGGPTDGTSLLCRSIDDFVALGNTFVCGVGDDGGSDNAASGDITQGQSVDIEIQKGEAGNLRFDMWYSESDRFTVSLERPDGTIEGPFAAPANASTAVDQTLGDISMFHRGADVEFFGATSNRRELLIDFSGAIGTYKVILEGTQVNDGNFKASLNPALYSNENKFLSFVTAGASINDFASANSLITPGDYVVQNDWTDINGVFRDITGQGETGELWIGSSEGPTQDGRLGIDFVAPGEVCHAPYAANTFYESFSFNILQNSNGLYGIQNAVSASAPLSTGVIALMLEVNPELTPNQIRDILRDTSRADSFTGSVPNNTWGYGKLDALAAIDATFETLALEDNTVNISPHLFPNPTQGDIRIDLGKTYPEIDLTVTNILGQFISLEQFVNTNTLDLTIKGSSGIYFVSIVDPQGMHTTLKVIKK
ncbi:S8 family peptidase [Dokdonia sp.]|uniref:S8 family peptidase n=1 Tax=Dokdonia sp. TaxID=2024995 RepID=UPI003266E845